MVNDRTNLKDIIKAIYNKGLHKNFIIIGSWAEVFYEEMFYKYVSSIQTRDFDILIKSR